MQLVGRTAIQLATAVRDGEVTAREVVRAHLDHLAHVEHRLGAYVSVRRRAALGEAEELDARGDLANLPLAGVPVAIKDVVDVTGEATRIGSEATSPHLATQDDEVVERLRAAGAVVIGKTRCPELCLWGATDDATGISVSPWDPSRTAGGSSGGSAAAVAAGTVPLALASDGLGSVRIPAAATGCYGIKPGQGMLPVMLGDEPHWFGMSRLGPIATTVADASLMLEIMAGGAPAADDVPDRPLRVAVSWQPPAAGVQVSRRWIEAALEAGRLLRHAGHEVVRADPPYEPAAVAAAVARWTQGPAREAAFLGLDLARLEPRTRAHVVAGERLARRAPVDDAQAQRWRHRLEPFFAEFDVLLTPMFARVQPAARAWRSASWAANVAANLAAYPFPGPWNLADVPAASVPLGTDRGRPTAVQVVAPAGREARVAAVATTLESLVGWTRHAPGWGVEPG